MWQTDTLRQQRPCYAERRAVKMDQLCYRRLREDCKTAYKLDNICVGTAVVVHCRRQHAKLVKVSHYQQKWMSSYITGQRHRWRQQKTCNANVLKMIWRKHKMDTRTIAWSSHNLVCMRTICCYHPISIELMDENTQRDRQTWSCQVGKH